MPLEIAVMLLTMVTTVIVYLLIRFSRRQRD
jgi:hypothetical protein